MIKKAGFIVALAISLVVVSFLGVSAEAWSKTPDIGIVAEELARAINLIQKKKGLFRGNWFKLHDLTVSVTEKSGHTVIKIEVARQIYSCHTDMAFMTFYGFILEDQTFWKVTDALREYDLNKKEFSGEADYKGDLAGVWRKDLRKNDEKFQRFVGVTAGRLLFRIKDFLYCGGYGY